MLIFIAIFILIFLALAILRYLGSCPVDLNSDRGKEIRNKMEKAAQHEDIDAVKFHNEDLMDLIFNKERTPDDFKRLAESSAKKLSALKADISSKNKAKGRCIYDGAVQSEATFERGALVEDPT